MKNSRTQKALLNFIISVFKELVTLAVGLILPRLILTNFGSAYNGVTHSISQFISYIALMRAGIGGATRAALYKPLADNDNEEISSILASTQKFMKRISTIFVVFVLGLACIYPLIVKDFEWLFTASLILIVSISTFAEYYFGFTYQMLLAADQKEYIYNIVSTFVTVLNGVVNVVLINNNFGIHIVKLGSSLVFTITPIFLYLYVNNKYKLNKKAIPSDNKIAQRWDAFAHEAAGFIRNNSDIVVITLFLNVMEVSVYTVYHYVTSNIKKIIEMCTSSFGAAFGNMYAKKEFEIINENLSIFELIIFSLVSVIHSVTLVMLVPFALIYTKGITDANYNRLVFGILLTITSAFENIRIPYKTMVTTTGHYKETKKGAILESIINISISICCVLKFGLVGVAVGSLCAVIFRTFDFVYYLSRNVINRDIKYFVKHLLICSFIIVIVYLLSKTYMTTLDNWFMWIIYAFITTIIASILTLGADLIFYKKDFVNLYEKVFRRKLKS